MQNYEAYFQRAVKNIRINKKNFSELNTRMEIKGLSLRRRLKYARLFSLLNRIFKIPLEKIGKKDIEKFLLHLRGGNYSQDTMKDYFQMLKYIMKFLNRKIDFADYQIKFKLRTKSSEEILSLEEIKRLLAFCTCLRHKAIVSLLYCSGCRPAELLGLKRQNITIDENGIIINVDGKTGRRTFRVAEIIPVKEDLKYLIENLQPHEFVFSNMDEIKLSSLIKKTRRQAALQKRIYPYLFRHSSATYLSQFLTEAQMCAYFGWSQGSKMPRNYVHLTGRDINNKILEINTAMRRIDATHSQLQFVQRMIV